MDWIDKLTKSALKRVESGYYQDIIEVERNKTSFVKNISNTSTNPIIAEIKPASPSKGVLLSENLEVQQWAKLFRDSGAIGISVLTEPEHFNGSLANLTIVSKLGLPTLMKDFVVDLMQIEACAQAGGKGVLFIQSIFDRGYSKISLNDGIKHAHTIGLEVLLEVASKKEYKRALQTEANMIGVNNRDLKTLQVDLNRTAEILEDSDKDRIIWSMSGISKVNDIRALTRTGVDAFLIGTSLMQSKRPAAKLLKLKEA